MTTSACKAVGCDFPVPSGVVMCFHCWNRVPRQHREAVELYRRSNLGPDQQSARYWLAVEQAIVSVAVRDRRLTAAQAEARIVAKRRELQLRLEIEDAKARDTKRRFAEQAEVRKQPTTVVSVRAGNRCDVYVGRGSKYGNPWFAKGTASKFPGVIPVDTTAEAVSKFREWLTTSLVVAGWEKPTPYDVWQLRGKALGCFCEEGVLHCHARVLAELADNDAKDVYDDLPF